MSADDTRANVERPAHERPVRIEPPVPDLESTAAHWHGPAADAAARWRQRAIMAEQLVEQLRRDLARHRVRP